MKIRTAKMCLCLAIVLACPGAIRGHAQTFTTIHSFSGPTADGEYPFPTNQIPFDANGALYGTAFGGTAQFGVVYRLVPKSGGGWLENILYNFSGGADGRQPSEGLVFDSNGNLFGTTAFGGNLQACGGGCGTVFELSPPAQTGGQWTESVLYTFQGSFDGQYPGQVVFSPSGVLFGTTASGGTPGVQCHGVNSRLKFGCGTVFQLTPPNQKGGSWTKMVIHTFPATSADGTNPSGEITFDSAGNIYSTASGGGTSHAGIAYRLSPPNGNGAWTETIMHQFTGGSDGGSPGGTLVAGPNGVFYGTASQSGVTNESGVVFQLTQSGGAWTEEVIHTFPAFKGDGTTPATSMVIDPSGNLYGTTDFGGSTSCYLGCGTVFKLAHPSGGGAWTETVLHDLGNSGQSPNEASVIFHNGLLYGLTFYLGSADLGSVFTLTP